MASFSTSSEWERLGYQPQYLPKPLLSSRTPRRMMAQMLRCLPLLRHTPTNSLSYSIMRFSWELAFGSTFPGKSRMCVYHFWWPSGALMCGWLTTGVLNTHLTTWTTREKIGWVSGLEERVDCSRRKKKKKNSKNCTLSKFYYKAMSHVRQCMMVNVEDYSGRNRRKHQEIAGDLSCKEYIYICLIFSSTLIMKKRRKARALRRSTDINRVDTPYIWASQSTLRLKMYNLTPNVCDGLQEMTECHII